MISMCGNEATSRCIIYFWLLNFNNDVRDRGQRYAAARSATSHTVAHEALVLGLIMANRLIIFNKIQEETGLTLEMLQRFYIKIWRWRRCARSIRLMNSHDNIRLKRIEICKEFLAQHYGNLDDFITRLVTRIKSGHAVVFSTMLPKKKRSSMKWMHDLSPRSKKPRPLLKALKQQETVFYVIEDVLRGLAEAWRHHQ